MADAAYDVVIIGGGNKGLVTAMYLAKYGGMDVCIFERRFELGGALAGSEASAPGFQGDTHTINVDAYSYFLPVQADFPDLEEKGGKIVMDKGCIGIVTAEHPDKCCVVYNKDIDPDQAKTVQGIARFSGEKDADTYFKMWDYAIKKGFHNAEAETYFNLSPPPGVPSALDRWFAEYFKQPDCPIDAEWMTLPPITAITHLFDSLALGLMWARRSLAAGTQLIEPMGGGGFMHQYMVSPGLATVVGGTHSLAHAYIRIYLESGGKYFTHAHVDKVLIENGTAKGIRLADGTEIEARKLVLSDIDLNQLCFKLIGEEYFPARIVNKVAALKGGKNALCWYTWALNERPTFKAADFNPDINETQCVTLGSEDLSIWNPEYYLRMMGKNPSIKGTILHQSYPNTDKSRAPEGKATFVPEVFVPAADVWEEAEWLKFKRTHANEVMNEYQVYSDNMNWDNVVGYDPITPYDTAGRLINMGPSGDWAVVNHGGWKPFSMRPLTEFAQYRVDNIKNLYATGASWLFAGASSDAGYVAYKRIAEDFGLRKPWEEKGRTW